MNDNEYVAPDATTERPLTLLQRAHKAAANADVAEARSVDPADEIAFSVMYSLLALAHSAERIAEVAESWLEMQTPATPAQVRPSMNAAQIKRVIDGLTGKRPPTPDEE